MAELESLHLMDTNYAESVENDVKTCYCCDKCEKEFNRKDNFKRHYLNAHDVILDDFKAFEKSLVMPGCSKDADNLIEDDLALDMISYVATEDFGKFNSNLKEVGCDVVFQDSFYHCDKCSSKIRRKDNFKRHYLQVHKLVYRESQIDSNSKNRCIFPGCTEIFYHKSKMADHLKEKHHIEVNIMTKDFDNMDEFHEWKEREESSNFVWFPKKDERKLLNGISYSSFICQCNGLKQEKLKHSSLKRKMEKKNVICPARMLVKNNPAKTSQKVSMKYIKSHNHEISCDDIKNKPIPQKIKSEITEKLLENKSVEEVLSELHQEAVNSPSSSVQKVFIEKHKIKYLQQKLNLPQIKTDKTDKVPIEIRLQSITTEDFNPLLLYKPPLTDPAYPDVLSKSDFIMAIQTKEQSKLFQKYANGIVLMELAHPSTFIPYHILTVKVIDEIKQAYNVAHLITATKDEEIALNFFVEMKSRCSGKDLEINLVMTTLDVYGVESFQSTFGTNIQFIYSKWHFHKLLFSKLSSDCPNEEELRHQVYFTLVALIEQREVENFKVIASDFFHSYKTKCLSIVTFMAELYLSQPEKWALCFRNPEFHHCDSFMHINTTLQMVKACIGNFKDQVSVNTILHNLLDVDQSLYLKQMCRQQLVEIFPSSHVISLSIPDDDLKKVSDTQWLVSHNNETLEVNWNSEGCPEEFCPIRCLELLCFGLCQHMYLCNCRSDALDICSHIHKVHSFEMGVSHCQKTEGGVSTVLTKNTTFKLYGQQQSGQQTTSETKIKENISFLQSFIANSKPSEDVLREINKTLDNLRSFCQASK